MKRRGVVFSEEVYFPISELFGFTVNLRKHSSGSSNSHWEIINQVPFDVRSKANEIIMDIRKRKGLKQVLIKMFNSPNNKNFWKFLTHVFKKFQFKNVSFSKKIK